MDLSDNSGMKKSLLHSNPWLLPANRRAELLRVSAASSSAVEGIVKPFADKSAHAIRSAARSPRAKSGSTPG